MVISSFSESRIVTDSGITRIKDALSAVMLIAGVSTPIRFPMNRDRRDSKQLAVVDLLFA